MELISSASITGIDIQIWNFTQILHFMHNIHHFYEILGKASYRSVGIKVYDDSTSQENLSCVDGRTIFKFLERQLLKLVSIYRD